MQKNPKRVKKKTPGTDKQLDYNKVAGYQINILKAITFLYTSNGQVEFEIKNKLSFMLAPNIILKLRYESNKYV